MRRFVIKLGLIVAGSLILSAPLWMVLTVEQTLYCILTMLIGFSCSTIIFELEEYMDHWITKFMVQLSGTLMFYLPLYLSLMLVSKTMGWDL